jgi:beta-glucosidase
MPWASRVPAIVEGWLAGQGGGTAVAEILLGHANPCGKLAETFPARLADTPAYPGFPARGSQALYGEGVFTGYRWYDARRIEPLFEFGHGLSYTRFAYSDLRLEHDGGRVAASVVVRNAGARAGAEIVQLYVRERAPRLPRPDRELRRFAKVPLEPGEARRVSFELGPRDFASWDTGARGWAIAGGDFDVLVGASSRDIRLEGTVTMADRTRPRVLDRDTPFAAWMAHPRGQRLLEPILAGDARRADIEVTADGRVVLDHFRADMPGSKLVVMGVLDDDRLDALIAEANGARDGGGDAPAW